MSAMNGLSCRPLVESARRTAMPMPWMISGASTPTMCAPTTRWLAWSTTSFTSVRSSRPDSVCFSGRKSVL